MKIENLRKKYHDFFDEKLEREFIEDFGFFKDLLKMSNSTLEDVLIELNCTKKSIKECKIESYNSFCKSYKTEVLSTIEKMPKKYITDSIVSNEEARMIAEEVTINSKLKDLVNRKETISKEIADKIIGLSSKKKQVLIDRIGGDSLNNVLKSRIPEKHKDNFDTVVESVREKYFNSVYKP